jgi:hypothetical protein
MKAKLKVLLPGFTGNMNDVEIYYNAKLNKYIARQKVKPKFTPDNTIVKEIHAFRRRINVTEEYLNDCREYIRLFNQKFRRQGRAMNSWPNVYMKVMRALKRIFPETDFSSLSREEIVNRNLPCISIEAAVNAGMLEKVPGFETLNASI